MKWHQVKCIKYNTTEDALGNPVKGEPIVLLTTKGRHTPWTAEELLLQTYDQQRAATRDLERFVLKKYDYGTEALLMDGIEYPVRDVEDFVRYVMVTVEKYKVLDDVRH